MAWCKMPYQGNPAMTPAIRPLAALMENPHHAGRKITQQRIVRLSHVGVPTKARGETWWTACISYDTGSRCRTNECGSHGNCAQQRGIDRQGSSQGPEEQPGIGGKASAAARGGTTGQVAFSDMAEDVDEALWRGVVCKRVGNNKTRCGWPLWLFAIAHSNL